MSGEQWSERVELSHDAPDGPDVDGGAVRGGFEQNLWGPVPGVTAWDGYIEVFKADIFIILYNGRVFLTISSTHSQCTAAGSVFLWPTQSLLL